MIIASFRVGSALHMEQNAKSVQFQIATLPPSLRDTVQHTVRAVANAFTKIVIIKLSRAGFASNMVQNEKNVQFDVATPPLSSEDIVPHMVCGQGQQRAQQQSLG